MGTQSCQQWQPNHAKLCIVTQIWLPQAAELVVPLRIAQSALISHREQLIERHFEVPPGHFPPVPF